MNLEKAIKAAESLSSQSDVLGVPIEFDVVRIEGYGVAQQGVMHEKDVVGTASRGTWSGHVPAKLTPVNPLAEHLSWALELIGPLHGRCLEYDLARAALRKADGA